MNKLNPPATWNELNDLLWASSFDAGTGRYRPYTAFRGLPADYPNLRTGLQRIGDPGPQLGSPELRWRERRLIDSFRLTAHEYLPPHATDWQVLMVAQHYRLPTRLLDWTSSPYAALFFATEDVSKHNEEGLVWCVSRLETNKVLPASLRTILAEEERTNLFHQETLSRNFPTLESFENKCPADALLWFEPPSLDIRIVNQFALFSVMPRVEGDTAGWLAQNAAWHRVIPIPSRLKAEIRERLIVMNISERTMYPGLEGIARWQRAYYGGQPLSGQP